MFLSLPKYVLLNVLKDWLFIVEIGKLDSALCCHDTRDIFQGHLRDCKFEFNKAFSEASEFRLLSWLIKRNLIVSSLYLKEFSNQKPSLLNVVHDYKFDGLTHLTLACGPKYKSFHPILEKAANIHTLEIVNVSDASSLTIIQKVKLCPNLRSLSLDNFGKCDSNFFKMLALCTNQLTAIKMNACRGLCMTGLADIIKNNHVLLKFECTNCCLGTGWLHMAAQCLPDLITIHCFGNGMGSVAPQMFKVVRNDDKRQFQELQISEYWPLLNDVHLFPHLTTLICDDVSTLYCHTTPITPMNSIASVELRKMAELRDEDMCESVLNGDFFTELQYLLIQDCELELTIDYVADPRNLMLKEIHIIGNSMENVEMWLSFLLVFVNRNITVTVTVPQHEMRELNLEVNKMLRDINATVTMLVRE